ncbi:MAG: transposase, partial [Chthoniobacterales bacterium]
FLNCLGQACSKTGWEVHAWCLLTNHFHLVLETPQANLAVGMKWLLGTYTQRFNRRHRLSGHLFQ